MATYHLIDNDRTFLCKKGYGKGIPFYVFPSNPKLPHDRWCPRCERKMTGEKSKSQIEKAHIFFTRLFDVYHIVDNHDEILCGAEAIPGRFIHIFYACNQKMDEGRWCRRCEKARKQKYENEIS